MKGRGQGGLDRHEQKELRRESGHSKGAKRFGRFGERNASWAWAHPDWSTAPSKPWEVLVVDDLGDATTHTVDRDKIRDWWLGMKRTEEIVMQFDDSPEWEGEEAPWQP